jgi:hypothetical protein
MVTTLIKNNLWCPKKETPMIFLWLFYFSGIKKNITKSSSYGKSGVKGKRFQGLELFFRGIL